MSRWHHLSVWLTFMLLSLSSTDIGKLKCFYKKVIKYIRGRQTKKCPPNKGTNAISHSSRPATNLVYNRIIPRVVEKVCWIDLSKANSWRSFYLSLYWNICNVVNRFFFFSLHHIHPKLSITQAQRLSSKLTQSSSQKQGVTREKKVPSFFRLLPRIPPEVQTTVRRWFFSFFFFFRNGTWKQSRNTFLLN